MGTTSQGIVYPDPSSPIAGLQGDLQALAESVDDAVAPVAYSAGDLGVTVGSGWSLVQFTAVKIGIMRILQLQVSRTGGTITADSAGDIANQSVMTNFPPDWAPAFSAGFGFDAGATGGFGTFGSTVSLRTAMPNSSITNGTVVSVNIPYVAVG